MADTSAVLDLIDNAIDDYTSPDAMRWTPDPPKPSTSVDTITPLNSAPPFRPRTMWASIRLTMADQDGNVTVYFAPNRAARRAMRGVTRRLEHRQRIRDRGVALLKRQERARVRQMRAAYGRIRRRG